MMHNLQMLLKTVSGSSVYVSDTRYTAEGQVDYRLMANGNLKTDYTYYSWVTAYQAGKLWQLTTRQTRSIAYLQNLTYDYDDMGNVETILDTVANPDQTQTFLYDDLNRLTSAQANGGNGAYGVEQYAYSATSGNLSQKAGVSYTYTNGTHRVSSAGGVTYGYDANGNMTSRVAGGITYTLTYDLHNRLTGISGNGSTSTFVYDSDGNRVKGTVNGVETIYLGSYYEKRTSDNSIKTYYYAGGTRVAMNETGQVTKYMIGDHLGSTSLMVTALGVRVAGAQYEAWGENRGTLEDLRTSFRFTGQRKEDIPGWGEGLYFYNARWYDPALSRFLSADSIIPNGWDPVAFDRYAYVRNSPAMYTDPSGHRPCDQEVGGECISESGWYVPQYTIVNGRNLSHEIGRKTGISGADFYDWYKKLYFSPQSSWWWQMFGMDDDGFTIFDAMAVIMIAEATGHWSDVNLPEATIRAANYFFGNNIYGVTPMSIADYINWFAKYSKSAGIYVLGNSTPANPLTNPNLITPFTSSDADALNYLSSKFMNHPAEWDRGCIDEGSPCGWGNLSLYTNKDIRDAIAAHPLASFTYTGGDDAWFIPSGCIMLNYINPTDLGYDCPPVR